MKAVGTVSGLFCDEIAENTSMKKMCSNDNQEDSVCTFLCHQTKSGIGMGSQDLGSHKTLNIYHKTFIISLLLLTKLESTIVFVVDLGAKIIGLVLLII